MTIAKKLTRIRQSLQTGVLPDAVNRLERVTPFPEVDHATLLNSFVREAQAAGSEIFQPATHDDVLEILTDLVKQAGQPAITWADEDLPIKDIREVLFRAGVTRHVPDIARDPVLRRQQWHNLDDRARGHHGGAGRIGRYRIDHRGERPAAIARGLAAAGNPHRPAPVRSAVPDDAGFLCRTSAQELTENSSNLVFITGPSRTADIEMIITRGVHGPKRLCIVLLP